MKFIGEIYEPLYEYNNKKYIRVLMTPQDTEKIKKFHDKYPRQRFDPLDGNILTIKVPYRYNRVMTKMSGTKGVSSFVRGDKVECGIEFKGAWKVDDMHSGLTWVLKETAYVE